MTTLFDLTYRIASVLNQTQLGYATGGTTLTVIDTNGLALIDNDFYNGGTLWMLDTTDGLAPKNEMSVIKDFNNTSKTITLRNALTVTITAGDWYAVAPERYDLQELIQKVNDQLFMQGLLPKVDTSLTVSSNTTVYTLPTAAAGFDIRQIEYRGNVGDANDPQWTQVYNYRVIRNSTGAASTLNLAYPLPTGATLRITYVTRHDPLELASDVLDDLIHPDRIVLRAATELMRNYRDRTRLRHLDGTIDRLEIRAIEAEERHPLPPVPSRQGDIGIINTTANTWRTGSTWRNG